MKVIPFILAGLVASTGSAAQSDVDDGYYHIADNWSSNQAPGVVDNTMVIDSHTIVIGYSDQVDPPTAAKEKDRNSNEGPIFDVTGQTIQLLTGGRLHLSFYNDGNGGHANHFHNMLLGATVELRGGIIASQFGPEIYPFYYIDSHTHGDLIVYADTTWYDESNDREIEFDLLQFAGSATMTFYGIKNSPADSSDLWFDTMIIPSGSTARLNLWGATHGIPGKVSSNPAAFRTKNLSLPSGATLEMNLKDAESFEIRGTQPTSSLAGTIVVDGTNTIAASKDVFSLLISGVNRFASGAVVDLKGNANAPAEIFSNVSQTSNLTGFLAGATVILRDHSQIRLQSGQNANHLIGGTVDVRGSGTISSTGNKSARRTFDALVVSQPGANSLTVTETGSHSPVYAFQTATVNADVVLHVANSADLTFAGAVSGTGTVTFTGSGNAPTLTFSVSSSLGGLIHANTSSPGLPKVNVGTGVTLTLGGLSINGSPVGAGSYTASTLTGFTGSGTVIVGQSAPPPSSWLYSEDFGDGVANGFSPINGTWSVANGEYVATTDTSFNVSIFDVSAVGALDPTFNIEVTLTTDSTAFWRNAFVIFNWQDSANYAYVGMYEGADRWDLGVVAGGVTTVVDQLSEVIDTGVAYNVRIEIDGGAVSVLRAGTEILSHSFGSSFNGGDIGLGVNNSNSRFDNFSIESVVD